MLIVGLVSAGMYIFVRTRCNDIWWKMKKRKNMKIFIVGTGAIGSSLAGQLSKDGCEVTLIDRSEEVINSLSNQLDVIGFKGNGASFNTLSDLSADTADILIAVTNSDELNLLSCFTAHKLGAKHTIARVRDVDYAKQNHFYRDELGISLIVNPDLAAASELFRMMRFPLATRVETFAGGNAELVELPVRDDSPLIGYSMKQMPEFLGDQLLICAIVREGRAFVPRGNDIVEKNDTLYLTGTAAGFKNTFKKIKHPIRPLQNVMIAGDDRITYYLAEMLGKHGVKVTVVESDPKVCLDMASALPKASVMNDDALKYFDSMSESDIANTDAFIAITEDEEYNLIAAMYAQSQGIGKIAARVTNKSRTKVLHSDSIISVISREDTCTDRILGYSRAILNVEDNDAVESLYRLMDGKLEFIEFNVKKTDKNLNVPLKECRFKKNLLLAGIIRNSKMLIPHGDDHLEAGDIALVITIEHQLGELGDIYE